MAKTPAGRMVGFCSRFFASNRSGHVSGKQMACMVMGLESFLRGCWVCALQARTRKHNACKPDSAGPRGLRAFLAFSLEGSGNARVPGYCCLCESLGPRDRAKSFEQCNIKLRSAGFQSSVQLDYCLCSPLLGFAHTVCARAQGSYSVGKPKTLQSLLGFPRDDAEKARKREGTLLGRSPWIATSDAAGSLCPCLRHQDSSAPKLRACYYILLLLLLLTCTSTTTTCYCDDLDLALQRQKDSRPRFRLRQILRISDSSTSAEVVVQITAVL